MTQQKFRGPPAGSFRRADLFWGDTNRAAQARRCSSDRDAALAVLICVLVHQSSLGMIIPIAVPHLFAVSNRDGPGKSA